MDREEYTSSRWTVPSFVRGRAVTSTRMRKLVGAQMIAKMAKQTMGIETGAILQWYMSF